MAFSEGILGKEDWPTVQITGSAKPEHRPRQWMVDAIRPALLDTRCWQPRTSKLRSTAWLDGLRGFAALLVYFGHHQLWAHESLGDPEQRFENAYGYENRYDFATLPFVRIFFSGGHFAVSVFFVISGYVLSSRPLQLIHQDNQSRLSENIGSALFRRWFRLFLPVACVTFAYMILAQAGMRVPMKLQPTFGQEVRNWYKEFRDYSFAFDISGKVGTSYSLHIWSLPVGEYAIYLCGLT